MWPLIEEFQGLGEGVPAYNAATSSVMTLRAYITVVAADMPGREKMMRVSGNRSYMYCTYCTARGIWNGSIYCPMDPPLDAPAEDIELLKAKKRKPRAPFLQYQRAQLPMRNNLIHRRDADHIEATDHKAAKDRTGIAGKPALAHLASIDFPRSFPPDSMHLFFENVIPDMCLHYRGVFFKQPEEKPVAAAGTSAAVAAAGTSSATDGGAVLSDDGPARDPNYKIILGEALGDPDPDESASETDDEPVVLDKGKGKRTMAAKKSAVKSKKKAKMTAPVKKADKFRDTSDPWNIPKAVWQKIGADQMASAGSVPASFGRAPRDFFKHVHHFSGEEWKMQATNFLPIYLKGKLPDEDYEMYCLLADMIGTFSDAN